MEDLPNFAEWERQPLVDEAFKMYRRLIALQSANEQLRLDLKDAMKMVRQQHNKDDWK